MTRKVISKVVQKTATRNMTWEKDHDSKFGVGDIRSKFGVGDIGSKIV